MSQTSLLARSKDFRSPRQRSYIACPTIPDCCRAMSGRTTTFPKLVDFVDYWVTNLDGPLYRVRVAHRRLIPPRELRFIKGRAQAELNSSTIARGSQRSGYTAANT